MMLIQWLRLRRTPGVRPVPEERPGQRPAPWRRDDHDPDQVPPLVARLQEEFGDAIQPVLPVFRDDTVARVARKKIVDVCLHLRDREGFDFPTDLCGVHTPDGEFLFDVVIHLFSTDQHERLRLKVGVGPGEEMPTLTGVWAGMNWHERETYDLVGVPFHGHPNLKRILLPDDFDGHPLQKDFPLKG
ncbi:MAG: NADH-quinone oxidoreductase subunit C [Acidobacteria bacterium]|nr:MAG: NADH-quinone oxidoreductase subunit C [Acidobacteriota bacterium]TDI46622.1 MAG: NADH-quinone oxidoreductase subunit C [Acidobacteriota bacterium]